MRHLRGLMAVVALVVAVPLFAEEERTPQLGSGARTSPAFGSGAGLVEEGPAMGSGNVTLTVVELEDGSLLVWSAQAEPAL